MMISQSCAHFQHHLELVLSLYAQNSYVVIAQGSLNSEKLQNLEAQILKSRILRVILACDNALDSEILNELLDFLKFTESKSVKVELCLQVQNLNSQILCLEKLCECKNVVVFAFKI